ncbi:MAG: arsenate reductase ArsC, partial [Halomonas sp.]|nr:arsenate reductase ArsC [Halomonas sp.]
MKKIVFLCVANSARSQMAEALARELLPQHVEVLSAGSAPSRINPYAVTVTEELGIDMSQQYAKNIEDVDTKDVDTVITLCAEEVCPTFFGNVKRLHWPMTDPSAGSNDEAEILERFRTVRDQLKQRILVLNELLSVPE